jgi:subtilisin family serine protease
MAGIIALVASAVLVAAPAQGSRFSLVEARPAATAYLRLTGSQVVSPSLGIWRVRERDARRLRRDGLLRAAEPERRLRVQSSAIDPLVDGEWWLASVGATGVAAPGPGVPVAVIDTGVDFTHPEFAARPETRSLNAQSVVDTLSDFHGTAVASVVGAPDNGVGMVGVYPQASIYAYDADLSGAITNTALIHGIAAAAELGRVVINLSVGSTRPDPLLVDTVLAAVRGGALIVAASGNFGANSAPTYPADLPHVLTVGATDHTGLAAPFSSASDGVDVAAPGVGISAAVPFLYTVDGYQFLNGTSFSAPIVSGAAALVWTVRSDLDSGQIFGVLRTSAADIAPRGFDPETGFGMLDIPAALVRAAPSRDSTEPNDDVRLVRPGGLFASGVAPLTSRGRTGAFVRGSVDGVEDPDDVYRVWVPPHSDVIVRASNSSVRLRIWRPGTPTVTEEGAAQARDLLASRAAHVKAANTSRAGAYYYADVRLGRSVGSARYQLNVRIAAPAKR